MAWGSGARGSVPHGSQQVSSLFDGEGTTLWSGDGDFNVLVIFDGEGTTRWDGDGVLHISFDGEGTTRWSAEGGAIPLDSVIGALHTVGISATTHKLSDNGTIHQLKLHAATHSSGGKNS